MILSPILVYLAGPQDDVSKGEARGWREEVARQAPAGVAFFSPAHAYMNVNRASFPAVDHMNRKAIESAHAMIANLSGLGRGFGTIREIEFASANHTGVWVVGDLPYSLMTYDLHVVATVDEALADILTKVGEAREAMRKHPLGQIFGYPDSESE